MKRFEEQKFTIPKLKGISEKNIEEHLKLYAGYVKHANLILEKIAELKSNPEKNAYALGEINRRFGFEFNGMRNHEVYFRSLEGGVKPLLQDGAFVKAVAEHWGSLDAWIAEFKAIALTRGIGWAMLYYDPVSKQLLNAWVDEQHFGQLANSTLILGLDMWEHAYVADYHPSGKKQYIEDFFSNLNWGVVEKNFTDAMQR
ncbi:MAG TPA: superoxide dismutase [Candidatus Taylorbacteria bacterium]|nr:MAG: Manganese/iron superoxide dismutase-like protein [Parcubacteria group bacterium GW2011_GWA2_47_64]KKU95542.1 MAG: Manganese/iron superoxide dismutase-like protein [Parcubacteria group bacterium GW2011_GWC2_48_17]HBV01645.1 superoxide dismutase [Candidatus Taylorbacteria bacterium]